MIYFMAYFSCIIILSYKSNRLSIFVDNGYGVVGVNCGNVILTVAVIGAALYVVGSITLIFVAGCTAGSRTPSGPATSDAKSASPSAPTTPLDGRA